MIYLDNGATTKICKEAAEAMEPYLNDMYGNPSGIYTLSKKSRNIIEETREKIAGVLNCKGENIILRQEELSRIIGFWKTQNSGEIILLLQK